MNRIFRLIFLIGLVAGLVWPAAAAAGNIPPTEGLGPRDALLVTDANGLVLAAHNPDKVLVPASTLKVVTALAARHYLGADFRFQTDFLLDADNNLVIQGYGDPLLVSEVLADIARNLHERLNNPINAILLDDGYFRKPLVIPGVSTTNNPYDAPNGALCVNFNTVNFKTRQGKIVSAEPQTPLLPMAKELDLGEGQPPPSTPAPTGTKTKSIVIDNDMVSKNADKPRPAFLAWS